MRSGSLHPNASELKTLKSQQLDRNVSKLSDVIRVQAHFGVGFVKIMDDPTVDSSADVEMNESKNSRKYEPNDEMTSSKSAEGSQGSRENLDMNPFELPTRKRHSITYTHGSEEMADTFTGVNKNINTSKKLKVSLGDSSHRDCFSEQKADHTKSDVMLMGSVLNASIGNTSPEKLVGALEQVVTRRHETVSPREVVNVDNSSAAVLVEETNDQCLDTQIALVPDSEPKAREHSGSHAEIQDPETFDEVKEPTKNVPPIPEPNSDNNGEPKTCSAESLDSADGNKESFQSEQDEKTKSETQSDSLTPELVQPSSEYQISPTTTANDHSSIEEYDTVTAQNSPSGEDQADQDQVMVERSLHDGNPNSDLLTGMNPDAVISSYKSHRPSVSNIDMNPNDGPQVERTLESNYTPSLVGPLSTDAEMDQLMEERSWLGENPTSNLLAGMAIPAIPYCKKLALSESNIDINLSNRSLVDSAPESEHKRYLIGPYSTGAKELSQSEQPHSSEEASPKLPEENRIASPQLLPPSDFQLEFYSPAEDETSSSNEEAAMTETTAGTDNFENQNNPNLVEDVTRETGDPIQQTAGSDTQKLPFDAESPPDQSDISTKAEPRLLNSVQSTEPTAIILNNNEDGNLSNETREVRTIPRAILPLEGRTQLPEPPKRTLALKEAAARLACTRTDNEQQLKTNSLDVQAGIHLRTILEKRATDTITFPELSKAIFQGMPTPPRIYKIQVEPNSNFKKHEHEINDGVTEKMTWITGSYHLQRYLCWPCLLFSTEVWEIPVTSGFDDIVEAAKVHQITTSHMTANIKLLFQETALMPEQNTKSEADRESRIQIELLLKRLIEITCSNNSISTIDEYIELMDSACSNDVDVQEFLVQQTAVSQTTSYLEHFVISNSPVILEAMEQLLHNEIIAEIEKAQFVTVIFEEMTNVVDKSSVAVILRYIGEFGVPRERFVKMIKLGSSRTVADLLQMMNLLVQEYQLKKKLVGFTYSGTVISAREVLIFNKTVNRLYPKARFFPYQEHNFKKIIEQSLSHLPACRHFFYTINELAELLEKTPNVIETLNTLGMPHSEQNTCDFVNDFVATLKNYYKTIMEFFDLIMKDGSGWDPLIVMQVEYFSHFLNSPNCQILVMVVSTILDAANDLCSALQDSVNIELWKRLLSETRNKLSKMKNSGLGEMIQASEPLAVATEYAKLFDQIIETAILTVNHRLADLEMAFVGQPFIEAASQCNGDALFAYQQRIGMNPENFFQLQIEAKSFFGDSPSAINIEQAMKNIYSNKNHAKSHLLKFLQLSQTIPTRESYTSNAKPATHTLRSYITTTKSQNTLDLLLLTGKDILSRMRQEEDFYDIVLELCLQKTEQNQLDKGIK